MAIAPLEAWEVGLDQAFTEQQQGLIFEKLGQQSKPGHLVVAEIWSSLHHASAEKLKGAIGVHVPELRAGLQSARLQKNLRTERLWAGIKAMKLKPKQSVDVSTQISSLLHCRWESNSDDEDLADNAEHAGGKNDEDMGNALPSVPFKYLELFTELRDLFSAPEGLLIRSCYKTLHEAMMIAAEERGAKMLVIGTPGIGKTSWIIYLLWKLANAGKTVLLDLNQSFYLFSSNGCYRARHFLDEFDGVLEDPGAFYIVDNKQPITNAIAMTLEIACPDHQKTHEFKKDASVFYMPPFTLNELEASRVWFPNVTADRMLELYGKWGGSVRWVLKRGGPKDSIDNANELTQAIDVMRVEMLNRASSGGAAAEIISGIIHHVPNPHDLKRYERQFASRYIVDELAATAAEPRLLALTKFLNEARPNSWGSVQKAYSESMARQQNRQGPAFQQRLL